MKRINNYILEKLHIGKDMKSGSNTLIEGEDAIAFGIDPDDGEIQITKILVKEVGYRFIVICRYAPLDPKELSSDEKRLEEKNSKGYFEENNLYGKNTVILPSIEGLKVIDFIINNSEKNTNVYKIYNLPIKDWMDFYGVNDTTFMLSLIYTNMLKIKKDFKNE